MELYKTGFQHKQQETDEKRGKGGAWVAPLV